MYSRVSAPGWLYKDEFNENDSSDDHQDNEGEVKHLKQPMKKSGNNGSDTKDNASLPSSETSAPKNVPKHLWEKFQKLEKRTDDVTRRSTEKRMKQIQNEIMIKVHEEISRPEDVEILRAHDVKFGPPNEKSVKKKSKKRPLSNVSSVKEDTVSKTESKHEAEFSEINKYMGVNDHLKGIDHGQYARKTEVEEKITEAIAKGDIKKAEELSDHLATREFGKRVCEAIDAKAYVQQKKEESETAKAKRKKKLPWGFLHKEKWETKGNM